MSNQPSVAADHPPPTWQLLRWRSRMPAYREQLAEGVPLTLLRLPAGSFWMGAPVGEEGRQDHEQEPQRQTVRELLMGQTPVTQAQWRAVAEWQPREGEPPWELELNPDPSCFRGDKRPVEQLSWLEAEEFCRRLRLRTGKNYRLPSEAQWEYACRAGTTTPFHFGETITSEVANFGPEEAEDDGLVEVNQTTDVASFPANAWGLHDMHGNVWEWCSDHWHDTYKRPPVDGRPRINQDADENHFRLLRGGSWYHGSRAGPRPTATMAILAAATTMLASAFVASPRICFLTLRLFMSSLLAINAAEACNWLIFLAKSMLWGVDRLAGSCISLGPCRHRLCSF